MRGQWKLDTVYILAKELAYNVLNTRKTELKTALGKASGAGMAKFAEALHTHHAEIDKKLCKKGQGDAGDNAAGKCGTDNSGDKSGLKAAMGTEGAKHWPKISADSRGSTAYKEDSTEHISDEMVGFNTDEKVKTAGLFARTVEVRCSIYISEGTGV